MKKKTVKRILVVSLAMLISFSWSSNVYAQSTQDKLDQKENERDETQQEKDEAEEKLKTQISEQKTLQGTLSALNAELTKVCENLATIEGNILVKEGEIDVTRAELEEAQSKRDEQDYAMKKRIQFMYESSTMTYLDMIFSAGSFSEMINGATYINSIADYDRKMLNMYKGIVDLIEEKEVQLNKEMAELARLKVEAVQEQNKVMDLVEETSVAIAKYADEIENLEDSIEAYEKELAEQNKDIEALRRQLEAEKANSSLAANSAWRDISQVTFEEGDRKLLANLIYCEARGESYEGKVAVASVVINRVLSERFPNTAVGVIYAPGQFAPVTSTKNSLALALAEDRASIPRYQDCYRAADEAMSGYSNVGRCVYFRTPIPGLTGTQIGNHIFY